jgi:hypothetical protein
VGLMGRKAWVKALLITVLSIVLMLVLAEKAY